MKKLLLTAAVLLSLGSCDKDESSTTPSGSNNGTIRYTNTSNNPYGIYLDGTEKGSLDGNKHLDISALAGSHNVKAIQLSGYVLYPTERTLTLTVNKGSDVEFIFP